MSAGLELRDAGDYWKLSGLATTYGMEGSYFVGRSGADMFREIIEPRAFENATAPDSDVLLLMMHIWDGPVLASTARGTLAFSELDHGLGMDATLRKSSPFNVTAVERVQSGEWRSLSVGMKVLADSWPKPNVRYVKRARLVETSLVDRPANPQARVELVTRADGDPQIEYRYVPLNLRQEMDATAEEYDDTGAPCPECRGQGRLPNGTTCLRCDGTGRVPTMPEDEAEAESRRNFTDAEKTALGKQGKAVYIDGHWAFPTPTRADFDNAVRALGRTPGKNRATVRKYLIRRARAEGWPIPASWNSDGTTKRALLLPNDTEDLRDLLRLRSVA